MQPIHMAQRPLIAQQALHFAPTVAVPLLARLVELGLRGLTAIEPSLGIKPRQRGVNLLHRLLGVHRLIEEPLCLVPGPSGHTRDSARITSLPLVPCHLGIGLTRRFELPLGVFPLTLYDACEFALGVKDIKTHRHCLPGNDLGSLTPRASPWPPSAMTCSRHGQLVITARQLSPLRSGPRWPAIHAMLCGSIAINTGARCRKISSRQSTRTRA